MAAVYSLNRNANDVRVQSQPSEVQSDAPSNMQMLPAVAPKRSVALQYRDGSEVQAITLSNIGVRSVIDESAHVIGNISSVSSIAVRGAVDGDISVEGEAGLILIYPGARVNGKLRARYLWLAGNVQGSLECQRLLVFASGQFLGEAQFEKMEIRYGAQYVPTRTEVKPFEFKRSG